MAIQNFFINNHRTFDEVKPKDGYCSFACSQFFKKSSFGFEYPNEAVAYLNKKGLLIKESQVKGIKISTFIVIYCHMVSETGHTAILNTASQMVHSPEGTKWIMQPLSEFKKRCSTNKYFKEPIYYSYHCGSNKILSLRS